MAGEVFKLSLLLEYKGDGAAKGVDGLVKLLQKLQAEGKKTIAVYNNLQKSVNKGFKVESPKGLKNLKKDLTDISKEFDKVAKKGRGVFSDTSTRTRYKDPKDRTPQDAKDELDRITGKTDKRGAVQRLADLNEKVFQPAAQIKDVWKDQYESLRQYTDEASKLVRLQGRFKLMNLPEAENQKVFSAVRENVKNIRGISLADSQEIFTDIYNALGDVDSAISALPMASKYKVASSALYGDISSPEQIKSQIQQGFKFLELTGATRDRATMESRFDVLTKVLSSTGGEVTMAKFLALGKQASPIMQTITDKGIFDTSATIDVMGGNRVGTALSALNRAWVGGIMPGYVAERYQQLGLVKEGGLEYNKAGKPVRIKPGANILGDTFVKDPLEASKMLADAIRADAAKKGIDVSTPEGMNKQMRGLFGTETQYRLANEFINNLKQVEKESGRAQKSKGVVETYNQEKDSPLIKLQEYEAAMKNFKTDVGLPLLQTLGKLAETTTPILSFFADHPTLTQWALAAILAGKGVKGILETASALNQSGLISFFKKSQSSAEGASKAIGNTSNVIGGLRSKNIGIGLQIASVVGIDAFIRLIQWEIEQAFNAGLAKKNAIEATNKNYQSFQNEKQAGTQFSPEYYKDQANTAWFSAMKGGLSATLPSERAKLPFISFLGNPSRVSQDATERELYPLTKWAGAENKFQTGFGGGHNRESLAEGFRQTTPQLKEPQMMIEFLRQINQRIPNREEQKPVREALATAYPDSYLQASQTLAQNQAQFSQSVAGLTENFSSLQQLFNPQNNFIGQFGDSLTGLQQPISLTNQNVANLADAANRPINPLNSVGVSASIASGSLNNLSAKLANWTPPMPNVQTYSIGIPTGGNGQPVIGVQPLSKASGGTVLSDGLVYVHAGEDIMPADITKQYRKSERDSPVRQIAALGFDRKENNPSQFLGFRNNQETDEAERENVGAKAKDIFKGSHSPKGTNMTIHYAPVTNVSGNASAKDLEMSERKNRLEFEKMLIKAIKQANQQSL